MSDYKYYRKTFTYNGERYEVRGKTEKEAFEKLGELKAAVKRGEVGLSSKMTVKAWSEEWLKTYIKPKVRKAGAPKQRGTMTQKSYSMYTDKLNNYILPVIGSMKLDTVKDIHLQRILNDNSELASSTVSKIKIVIKALFKQAYISRLIGYDPSMGLITPATDVPKKRRNLTSEEHDVLMKVAETHRCGLWIKFLLRTGCRPSETAPLLVSDLDFKKNLIHITKTIESGTKVVSMPKTDAGMRYIPIPKDMRECLKEAVENKKPSDYVFPQTNGKSMMTITCISNNWRSFSRQMDLAMGAKHTAHGHIYDPKDLLPDGTPMYPDKDGNPINGHVLADDLCLYTLRHTYCSNLQKAGVPLNVAKEIMGHSSIEVTANIYSHADEKTFIDYADVI